MKTTRPPIAWLLILGLTLAAALPGRAQESASTPRVPESVEFVRAIPFGEAAGQPLLLDLAQPKAGAGPYPVPVFVHGGGWAAGRVATARPITG